MKLIEGKYTSPNGYTGRLYGKSSFSIYDRDGHEVFHTGFRNPNIDEVELKRQVDEFPKFLNMLKGVNEDEETELEDSRLTLYGAETGRLKMSDYLAVIVGVMFDEKYDFEIARLYEDFGDDEHKVVEYSQSRSQYDELIQVIKYASGYEHIYCMFPYGTPDERRERREKDGNKEC